MTNRVADTLSLFGLMQMYPTEKDAIRYMELIRWGNTPCCTRCGSTEKISPNKKRIGDYWCGYCRQYFTARTGTPLEHSRVRDVRKWIYASYLLMTSRKGISALRLKHELNVSYPTAWYMLHRLRLACGSKLEALRGIVEVGETYLGGKEENKREHKKLHAGRGGVGKRAVFGMRERGDKVKAVLVADTTGETLQDIVHENVRSGSTICTNESAAYNGVANRHRTVYHPAREYVNGMAHTNGIESVWAVLNKGNCERDTKDRLDDLFRSMSGKTITYKELTA